MLCGPHKITTVLLCGTGHLLGVDGFGLAAGGAEHDYPQQEHDER